MTFQISYFLEDTDITSENATALAQADALIARGHSVRLVTRGLPLTWRGSRAEWIYVDDFREYDATRDDFALHLDDIAAIGQIVDDEFYRARTPVEKEPMRILLCGESQFEVKGIREGYGAVAHARWFHQKFDLVRVSVWAPSKDEPLDSVQEFHVALTTAEMTRLMHSCDVLIAPNHREERMGLPAAEALAAGIPTVMTSIPVYLSFEDTHDYALFAPDENAVEMGEKLIELLGDPELRDRLRKRGREVAEQWRAPVVAERMEKIFSARR
jgi:hypothetical protein